jgi:hypothetical protein
VDPPVFFGCSPKNDFPCADIFFRSTFEARKLRDGEKGMMQIFDLQPG